MLPLRKTLESNIEVADVMLPLPALESNIEVADVILESSISIRKQYRID